MTLERVSEIVAFYGREVVLLIGGALFADGPDLAAASARFVDLAGRA